MKAAQRARRDTLHDTRRDLVVANRILAHEGILDAFGHVSVRHPFDPTRFLLSRMMAPGQVDTNDILEFDRDSQPVKKDGARVFVERFIHGEIYRLRPDVMAVVHSHSPSLIPYGTNGIKLKPMYHMSAFLGQGAPVFDIRDSDKRSDMLVRNGAHGSALARSLGEAAVALMRGHGKCQHRPHRARRHLPRRVLRTQRATAIAGPAAGRQDTLLVAKRSDWRRQGQYRRARQGLALLGRACRLRPSLPNPRKT